MKRLVLALLLVPAFASAARPESRWAAAAYFDVLAPGNQLAHLRSARGALCHGPQANGIACNGAFSSYAALGGRLGLFHEDEDYRWGASVGALSGGPDRGRVSVNTSNPAGAFAVKTQSTLVRLLGEAGQKFLLTEDWYGVLGAGMGMAMTNQTTSCSASGALGAACGNVGGTTNYGWFAWELAPSIQYQELEVGFRYAGFARGGHTPWNTWGATVGWHFY